MSDFVLEDDSDLDDVTGGPETVLPTFVVLARFAQPGPQDAAVAELRRQLTAAEAPFDDVRVEREEPDGAVMVLARFVVVSVDAGTGVAGVHDDLRRAGLPVDEVWVDQKL
jgi:cytochrome b